MPKNSASVRDKLVIAMSKELLGPRDGRTEKIDKDPKYEYVTGVLEPKDYQRGITADLMNKSNSDTKYNTDGEPSVILEGHSSEDESDPDLENIFLQTIDPRAFPKSMGMAFMLDENDKEINICVTWARYKQVDESLWERIPEFMVLHPCKIDKNTSSEKNHVRIEISLHRMENSTKYVYVRLINKTPPSDGQKLKTHDLIFQPQIRMSLQSGSVLKPLPEPGIGHKAEGTTDDEKNSALLYRDRSAYGRGFQCSVLWKDVDPEFNSKEYEPYEQSPYGWADVATVDPQYRTKYMQSDIRTEFLPVYQISSANKSRYLEGFAAEDFARNFSKEFYQSDFLQKIVEQYAKWIETQKKNIDPNDDLGDQAACNLVNCTQANNRIKNGIQLLIKNKNARLAFCFMNKAMDKQALWTRKDPLVWKPFQISFILMCLEGIVDKASDERNYFDLLWYPTGGGKTEAYLGLAVFAMAFRRLEGRDFDGVSIISRYTLRLLTIQQFRRALKVIVASEVLRIENWHPDGDAKEFLWGRSRFSIGLWVGRSVTPNNLIGYEYRDQKHRLSESKGAVDFLLERTDRIPDQGDPAQILNCPACNKMLVFPNSGISGIHDFFWIVESDSEITEWHKKYPDYEAKITDVSPINDSHYSVHLELSSSKNIERQDILSMADDFENERSVKLKCAAAIFPGYFLKRYGPFNKPYDFEIRCPNNECELNKYEWHDHVPTQTGYKKHNIIDVFRKNDPYTSHGIPITAYTVDDQIYHRCPSMLVATVDKVARLAFEPKGAAIFGNINSFDENFGYYRDGRGCEPDTADMDLTTLNMGRFDPPDLIIQDELHLIEGPLGTMVGIYEMAIDVLASNFKTSNPSKAKYVGSTATIKEAPRQVSSIYDRNLAQFPPNGISASDNFFVQSEENSTRDDVTRGRLYMGICTPGTSSQTALNMIWSVLLQTPKDIQDKHTSDELDRFLTTIGYFNSIRELSSAVGRYRQDIQERIQGRFGPKKRELGFPVELSSRIGSDELPGMLDNLEKKGSSAIPGVFATSMFGTGVDIDRVGLMVVHGQPKTTASYIQSTGRIGRSAGGLVVVHFNAVKPRDLDHYEFFTRYHRSIHRYVEPITVTPFSTRCLERAAGPVSTIILRNSQRIADLHIDHEWRDESKTGKHSRRLNPSSGSRIMKNRKNYEEIDEMIKSFVMRSQHQPSGRKPDKDECKKMIESEISAWSAFARQYDDLLYWESPYLYSISHHVVLGDDRHDKKNMSVYENAPQSLRNVESTTRFK